MPSNHAPESPKLTSLRLTVSFLFKVNTLIYKPCDGCFGLASSMCNSASSGWKDWESKTDLSKTPLQIGFLT